MDNKHTSKKIWESSKPCFKLVNNDGDKSYLKHLLAILGLNSMKSKCDANKFVNKGEDYQIDEVKVSALESPEK